MKFDTSSRWIIELHDEMERQLLHLRLTDPETYQRLLAKQRSIDPNNDAENM